MLRIAASFGDAERSSNRQSVPLDRSTVTGRSICDLQPVQVADLQSAGDEFPLERKLATTFRYHTTLSVPLIRGGRALGAILVRRTEVRPFEERHVALLKAFADQAVIAIENVRLFEAGQQRTRETKSSEQQTDTPEVLQVVSSFPGDLLQPFAAMLENAVRIFDANSGNIYRWDGEVFHLVATHNMPPAFAEARRRYRPDPKDPFGVLVANKAAIHIANLPAGEAYIERRVPEVVAAVEIGGVRTVVAVPIMKENELIGALTLHRREVRPFTDKQTELLATFAAKAVTGIENTRLLNELREFISACRFFARAIRWYISRKPRTAWG